MDILHKTDDGATSREPNLDGNDRAKVRRYVVINPMDNVAVALQPIGKGEIIDGVAAAENIPAGHKIALKTLHKGDDVIKYGYPIGHLTESVEEGRLIDHRVLKTNLAGILEYEYKPTVSPELPTDPERPDCLGTRKVSFAGYLRKNGEVGIRNQIWVIPTVGCVNGVCDNIVRSFTMAVGGNVDVDAVTAFKHNYGCSQLGEDHENTRVILADMVLHPNAGAVLVVGLGCENNQLSAFRELVNELSLARYGQLPDAERVRFMECQKIDGDEVEYGVRQLKEMYEICSKDRRTEQPVSKLKVGLKCGGSDGLSGITANPLLGEFSDWIVSQGGTTVLTEVPEMFGAETLLMNRCADRQLFDKTVSLINDFKKYFMDNGQPVYENPSPGNKAGGISTLEEKSLGCTQKSGHSPVRGVLKYGEWIRSKGLNLLSAPGNDLVASTALGAAGCQLVLFTTGRGTPFGSFVPTMKISTNSVLFRQKQRWIDFNAGCLADGAKDMSELRDGFIDRVLSIAGGEPVCNEENGISEIAIFKTGITL